MSEPSPSCQIPDLVEPILAWRAFRIDWESITVGTPFVTGQNVWAPWYPGPNRARCHGYDAGGSRQFCTAVPSHPDVDHGGHGCGIYAVRFAHQLRHRLHARSAVAGLVQLWGRVHPHEFGYRAEYAQILHFCTPPTSVDPPMRSSENRRQARGVIARIAETYDIEVRSFPPREDSAEEQTALDNVEHLRDHARAVSRAAAALASAEAKAAARSRRINDIVPRQPNLVDPLTRLSQHRRDAIGAVETTRHTLRKDGPR